MTDDKSQKPVITFYSRSNPTPDLNNPPQKEKEGMAIPTAEEIKGAMPVKPKTKKPVEPKKTASEEEKKTYEEHLKAYHEEWNSYYGKLQAVGMTILKGFFAEKHHDNLTARRPFSGLKKTEYYADAKKVKDSLTGEKKPLKDRSADIGHGVQLASQEIWLGKAGIPNLEKLTSEEKFALIGWKNEDLKKEVLKEYLTATDDKRTVKNLKAAMTRGETKKAKKTETEKEKAAPKAKAQPAVIKAKPVIGKKEIDALIKQAETAEKELTKAKADLDKAMDKVKQAHGKIKEELLVAKRLMDREG